MNAVSIDQSNKRMPRSDEVVWNLPSSRFAVNCNLWSTSIHQLVRSASADEDSMIVINDNALSNQSNTFILNKVDSIQCSLPQLTRYSYTEYSSKKRKTVRANHVNLSPRHCRKSVQMKINNNERLDRWESISTTQKQKQHQPKQYSSNIISNGNNNMSLLCQPIVMLSKCDYLLHQMNIDHKEEEKHDVRSNEFEIIKPVNLLYSNNPKSIDYDSLQQSHSYDSNHAMKSNRHDCAPRQPRRHSIQHHVIDSETETLLINPDQKQYNALLA